MSSHNKTQSFSATISDLNSRGQGIARTEGQPVAFVDRVLPEEQVELAVYRREKRWQSAWPVKILEASSERQEPDCPHYEICGGCSWRHVSPESEVTWKERVILNALPETASTPDPSVVLPRNGSRQRLRATLHDGQPCLIGPPPKFAPFALPTDPAQTPCPALDPAMNACLADRNESAGVHESKTTQETDQDHDNQPDTLRLAVVADGDCRSADDERPLPDIEWYGHQIVHDPALFFQPSLTGAKAIADTLRGWLTERRFGQTLDLYGGAGLWLLALDGHCERGLVLENNRDCRKLWVASAARRELRWKQLDLDREDVRIRPGALVIFDPPRSGLSRRLRRQLPSCQASVLLQISCYADTLLRDAKLLHEGGWRATHLRFVHQYPGTSHVETLVMWEREDR